jgi:hypothetical protein
MISDLSPGDKLSLKGKIFELQKRLNILDIESKRNNEMSTMFKPTIYTYSLPSRERYNPTALLPTFTLFSSPYYIYYNAGMFSTVLTKQKSSKRLFKFTFILHLTEFLFYHQQKKELLKASILAQIDEGCTFTPVISNKAKTKGRQGALTDERPVLESFFLSIRI